MVNLQQIFMKHLSFCPSLRYADAAGANKIFDAAARNLRLLSERIDHSASDNRTCRDCTIAGHRGNLRLQFNVSKFLSKMLNCVKKILSTLALLGSGGAPRAHHFQLILHCSQGCEQILAGGHERSQALGSKSLLRRGLQLQIDKHTAPTQTFPCTDCFALILQLSRYGLRSLQELNCRLARHLAQLTKDGSNDVKSYCGSNYGGYQRLIAIEPEFGTTDTPAHLHHNAPLLVETGGLQPAPQIQYHCDCRGDCDAGPRRFARHLHVRPLSLPSLAALTFLARPFHA